MRAPKSINGVQPVSASVNTESGMEGSTRELSSGEVLAMVEDFATAAKRCEQAGFDGVELHGAHSYLICQFLGIETNRREDEWGGTYDKRKRFLWAIIDAIRAITSPDFLIFVRISPVIEKMGIHLDESLQLAKDLAKAKVDGLHISCWDVFQTVGDDDDRLMTQRFADALPNEFPLISTGAVWSAKDAHFVMEQGAHLVGVARVAIGHADWAEQIADSSYNPQQQPFTAEHLAAQGLSPVFIDYMRRWKNFVI
jgi:2,4-dienoyl-CoA reductase-like NADH-dependent reductase (Old Yellow Enzyme family)